MEKKNELPKNWTTCKLAVLTKSRKIGISRSRSEQSKNGIPYLKMNNITTDGKLDLLSMTSIQCTNQEKNDYMLESGDIIFNTRNSFELVGKTALWNNAIQECVYNNNLMRIRVHDIILPKFLVYFMNSTQFRNSLLSIKKATTNICAIYDKDLKEEIISIPPINEQKRIVKKVEELFSLIDSIVLTLQKSLSLLNSYKRTILFNAFTGNLTSDWRKKQSVHLNEIIQNIATKKIKFPKKFQKLHLETNSLWELPSEWTWINLGLLIESLKNGIYKPKSFYNDDGIACLRMYNIDDGELVWKNIKRMNLSDVEISENELLTNDLLVNRVNSRELVGKTTVIPKGIERCVFESKNIRLRLFENFSNAKLVSYWFQFFAQSFFNKNAQQTVGMASINHEQITIMPFPYFSIDEQNELSKRIDYNFSMFKNMKSIINNNLTFLSEFRNAILQRAFEGKLVPQDPNDEPASELLKQIKNQ